MTKTSHTAPSGFSLVELSIVLVILGLLVGGILGGQSLIRAAELRSVTVEYQQLQTAINTFRQKYHAFPGDMPNATRFWGLARAANGCWTWDGSSPVSPTGGTATCNGDGSGTVAPRSSTSVEGGSQQETALFWSHLANAGLVNNLYTGTPFVIGMGQSSKLSGSVWTMLLSQRSPFTQHDIILIGSSLTSGLGNLPPEEAWGIDLKIDDGKPFSGIVFTVPSEGGFRLPDCTVMPDGSETNIPFTTVTLYPGTNFSHPDYAQAPADAEYKLQHPGNSCALIFAL